MELFLILFTSGLSAAIVGRWKGSSALLWFLIGFCLPLIGILAAFLYRFERDEARRECEGCGRVLPLTNQVCFSCGEDLSFPEQTLAPR